MMQKERKIDMQLSVVKEKVHKCSSKIRNLSKKKKIIYGSIAAVLVVTLVFVSVLPGKKQDGIVRTSLVERGDISVVISGTGTVKPIDEYEVTSLVKGEILSDTFQEGDLVEKGDLLYQIDSEDMENTLKKAQLGLQKSQLSYNQTMDDLAKLSVTSSYKGTITETYVKVGDSVNNGTKIADLVDMQTMMLSIPFNASDASYITVGSMADVTLTDSFYTLQGTVKRVSNGTLISAEGVTVSTVEIEVENPGALAKGDAATATVNGIACNSPGTFDYKLETTITAGTSGDVVAMYCGKGDVVSAGAVIASLQSASAETSRRNSQLSLQDSQLSIDNYNKQLEDYRITAPISGTVLKKTSKAGDTIDNSNAQIVMAVIADMSTIVFEMNVDELDISKIAVGQKVSVTADALENRVFEGHVDYVSVVGVTQNGVTTYPVTIVIDNPDGLIPGMNVSAEIVVESRQNVLRVPVSAVNRGNIVYVKGEAKTEDEVADTGANKSQNPAGKPGETSNSDMKPNDTPSNNAMKKMLENNVPDGFRAVRVETGLNDSDYIEIISGLSEGDVVYVIAQSGSSGSNAIGMMGMGGMRGGMGGMGGMPSGGMPTGNVPGGR